MRKTLLILGIIAVMFCITTDAESYTSMKKEVYDTNANDYVDIAEALTEGDHIITGNLSIGESLTSRDLQLDGQLTVTGKAFFETDLQDYAYLTLSANQETTTAGTNVDFDYMAEGNMTFDTTNNRLTLKAGKTYYLSACLRISGTTTSCNLIYRWYDYTNSKYIGNYGNCLGVAYVTSSSVMAITRAVITPTTDILVEVRIATSTNISSIHSNYSNAFIIEIK